MKRVWGQISVGAAVVAVAPLLMPGCTHNDSEIFIRDALAPPLVSSGQQCMFSADATQATISSGILDAGFSHSYKAEFLVGNQTVAQGNSSTLQTETSIVDVQYAVVRVTTTDGAPLSNFTYSVSASINPAVGSVPSYAPMTVEIVNEQALSNSAVDGFLAQQALGSVSVRVITYTKVFGHTLGGQAVESNEFSFPVDVCYGCLVGTLSKTSVSGAGSSMTVPCFSGQDNTTDCSLCNQNVAVCAAFCPLPSSSSDGGTSTDSGTSTDGGSQDGTGD